MNILHVSTALTWRGGEQQIAYLIEELTKEKKVKQWMLCAKNSDMNQHCINKNIAHVAVKKMFSFNLYFSYQLAQICQKQKIDIIHLHDAHAHNFAILAADIFRNKTKCVLSRRVDFPIRNNWYSHYKYQHICIKKIICVSQAIQKIVAKTIGQTDKLTYIYSGIDLGKFQTTSPQNILRKTYDIPKNHALIGKVAALADHKDYFTFIDTAHILLDKGITATFLMIGEGSERAVLQKYIQEKKLTKHIIMTGFRNDIPQILPELDLFLFTSKTEGLGTSVIDALSAGVPIVTTNAGGIIEIVTHNETALIAEIENSTQLAKMVAALLNNNKMRQNLVENGLKRAAFFSKENMATNTLRIYNDLHIK
ncbi:MAG: glycosyltransferase family 4 protein [Chitinophagales bacterium]